MLVKSNLLVFHFSALRKRTRKTNKQACLAIISVENTEWVSKTWNNSLKNMQFNQDFSEKFLNIDYLDIPQTRLLYNS